MFPCENYQSSHMENVDLLLNNIHGCDFFLNSFYFFSIISFLSFIVFVYGNSWNSQDSSRIWNGTNRTTDMRSFQTEEWQRWTLHLYHRAQGVRCLNDNQSRNLSGWYSLICCNTNYSSIIGVTPLWVVSWTPSSRTYLCLTAVGTQWLSSTRCFML